MSVSGTKQDKFQGFPKISMKVDVGFYFSATYPDRFSKLYNLIKHHLINSN